MTRVFITGTAGFIGYHLADLLLSDGMEVHGFDGMTDYYDVTLKRRRHQMLLQHEGFAATEAMLEDAEALMRAVGTSAPTSSSISPRRRACAIRSRTPAPISTRT
jgi:UDP-glucuronate 4-epimerase